MPRWTATDRGPPKWWCWRPACGSPSWPCTGARPRSPRSPRADPACASPRRRSGWSAAPAPAGAWRRGRRRGPASTAPSPGRASRGCSPRARRRGTRPGDAHRWSTSGCRGPAPVPGGPRRTWCPVPRRARCRARRTSPGTRAPPVPAYRADRGGPGPHRPRSAAHAPRPRRAADRMANRSQRRQHRRTRPAPSSLRIESCLLPTTSPALRIFAAGARWPCSRPRPLAIRGAR